MHTLSTRRWIVAVTAFLFACGGTPDEEPAEEAPAADQAARDTTGGMGMGGGMMGMSAVQMGDSTMGHMRMMEGMHGDTLMRALPMHRQMLEGTLSRMDGEMRGMNMAADPKWTALRDSLRDDLARMPQMSAAETESFMAEHRGRVSRMMELHRSMAPR